MRALVLSDVLQTVFEAGPTPREWLDSFRGHEETIVEVARRRYLSDPVTEPVLLREQHF